MLEEGREAVMRSWGLADADDGSIEAAEVRRADAGKRWLASLAMS